MYDLLQIILYNLLWGVRKFIKGVGRNLNKYLGRNLNTKKTLYKSMHRA